MWKDYTADSVRNNRTGSISVMVAAFIAALFLSFLCHLFYDFWLDDIERTKQEEGSWHGRLTGEISQEELEKIRHFANVETAVYAGDLSEDGQLVVEITFYDKRTVWQDMASIRDALGLPETAADYHYQLLSLYFVRIPGDEMPRLIMPAYLAIVAIVCMSLILVIHNSFAVSMNRRIHQFGILSGIGATPRQIRVCLVQEAAMLTLIPVVSGILFGTFLSFGTVRAMGAMAENLAGGRRADFHLSPAVLLLVLLLSVFTVLFSAWLPARKLSRLTPLEAVRGTGEAELGKKTGGLLRKHSPILSMLFGAEGELAGNALRAQKKALRTTSLSLTLAFLGFMLMQCFFTLSGISTNHTYFERYQDTWDVMVTVKNTGIGELEWESEAWNRKKEGNGQEIPEVRSCMVYQKAEAYAVIPKKGQSPELLALGGLGTAAGASVTEEEDSFLVKAALVIMEDESFTEYCGQTGITPKVDGAVLVNRIWDSINSNFRYPQDIPYVAENGNPVTLQGIGTDGGQAELPVLAYTTEYPVLREEYEHYALVNIVPFSLWKEIEGKTGGCGKDTYIRLLAGEGAGLEELKALEEYAVQQIRMGAGTETGTETGTEAGTETGTETGIEAGTEVGIEAGTEAGIKAGVGTGMKMEIESENRIQEKIDNDEMIRGYELVLGAFCILLAFIGIVHVFSNTLGFLHQRKREFARYLSIGLTPEGMRKIFVIEAAVIVGRPVLVSLVFTVIAAGCMIAASYLDPAEFLAEAPVVPVFAFILAVSGFVALAYYLGGRKVIQCSLAETLRDDTML